MRKNEEDQAAKLVQSMGSILIGGVCSLGICFVVLLFCSIGISSGWLSDRLMMQYTIGSCVIGGFCGAMFSVLRVRSKTLFVGLLTSVILFLLILSIGFLAFPEISMYDHGTGIAAGCLAGGVLAGFLGGKPKKKRRK